jgi:hypothetical protein
MYTDTFVQPVRRRIAAWCVRRDDEDLMTVMAKVLHHPQHRVGDAVDIREEGFCDDRNAHATMVASAPVAEVASAHTTRKVLVPIAANTAVGVRVFSAPRKGD